MLLSLLLACGPGKGDPPELLIDFAVESVIAERGEGLPTLDVTVSASLSSGDGQTDSVRATAITLLDAAGTTVFVGDPGDVDHDLPVTVGLEARGAAVSDPGCGDPLDADLALVTNNGEWNQTLTFEAGADCVVVAQSAN